jgi:hypothetical protein
MFILPWSQPPAASTTCWPTTAGRAARSGGPRVAATGAGLAAALLLAGRTGDAAVAAAVASALAICTVGVAWEFWRGRDVYLDPTRRDKRAARTWSAIDGPYSPNVPR